MEPVRHPSELDRRQPDPEETLQFLSILSRHPGIETGDVDGIIAFVVADAADLIDVDHLGVWLLDEARSRLNTVLRYDMRARRMCAPISLPVATVASELNAFRVSPMMDVTDALTDPRTADFRNEFIIPNGITALLDHAIRASGQDVGIFSLERRGATQPWSLAEKALAQSISSYLSLTYANRQKRQADAALRRSEERLRALTDNLPGAVYQRPPDPSAPFLFVSGGIDRFTGDATGQLDWTAFVHPDDIERVRAAYGNAKAGSEYNIEYRIHHPTDGEMWVLDRGRRSGPTIEPAVLDGVMINVTPRKKAERAAQSLSAVQNAILNNVGYAVIATDVKGTITFFNRASEELLGYTSAELVGRQTPLIFHDLAEIRARMQAAKDRLGRDVIYPFEIFTIDAVNDQPSEREWIYVRKDGRRLTVRLSVTMIRDESGAPEGFLGIASDVSDRKVLASKLRQSEDIAARVLLQSPDAILITSLKDGRILEANPGFEQITGIKRDHALGRSTIELDIWADLTERDVMIAAIRKSGEVTSLPIRINQRGGSLRYCEMWARAFTFENELALLSVVHDVTELRLASRAAEESQRMLQNVLDAMPSSVFWKDRNSVYLGCNRKFVIDSGIPNPDAVSGLTDQDMPWHSGAALYQASDRQVMESGIPEIDRVTLHEMPAGPPRWFSVSKLPLISPDGEIKGVLGIGTDVTEQKDADEKLRASEEKLRSLFETSPLGVTLTHLDGRFLEVNDAFLRILGYDREEFVGLDYQRLTAPEYATSDAEQVAILAQNGRYGPYDKEYIRRDGSRIAVSLNGSMVTGVDGESYVWTTVEDITIRRAAEEAQKRLKDDLARLVDERTAELKSAMEGLMRAEKLASLGSLVAGVAHEISTPVGNASLATSTMAGSIAEFEQQLADKLTRSALEGFVKQIKLGTDIANRNIERVAGLIQSFKQVAVDQTSSQRREFLLTEIVDEISTTMHPSLKRSSVKLETSVPGTIKLDSYPGPLGQILTNLISNSLVHAFPNGRAGTIRIEATQPDIDTLRLVVSDDGIGIRASALGRIFDPFYTSKLGSGGSGLGLHIVHNIMTGILAGSVTVASEEGAGTTFTLTLPCITPTPEGSIEED